MFTPDELMVVLGIKHSTLFNIIGKLVQANTITYSPTNGPGKWSYYDYYWLHESYKHTKLLNIKPVINRTASQIKSRASAIGLAKKDTRRFITNISINMTDAPSNDNVCLCGRGLKEGNQCKACSAVVLTEVERDYMISQINNSVTNILKG